MPKSPRSRSRAWNLASIRTGETVRIRRILFDSVRAHCAERRLREGDVVRCRKADSGGLMLETADGGDIMLSHEWTRFIQVSRLRALSISIAQPEAA